MGSQKATCTATATDTGTDSNHTRNPQTQTQTNLNKQGERKRKSVRGCIVGPDLSVLNLVVVKRGENAVAGLTDSQVPRRLGPKRANKIRKLFNLSKEDDVTKYVIARKFENKKGKTVTKRPKIQRLVTPLTLQVRPPFSLLIYARGLGLWGNGGFGCEGNGVAPSNNEMMIQLVHRPVLSLVRGPAWVGGGVVQTPSPPGGPCGVMCGQKHAPLSDSTPP